MLATINNGAYKITSIVSNDERIMQYTAVNSSGQKFIVNVLVAVELIKENLSEVRQLSEDHRLIAFLENDGLCILTPYAEGERADNYFERMHRDFCETVRLAKDYLLYLISIQSYPEILRKSAIDLQNIIIVNNEIFINLFIREEELSSEDNGLYKVFRTFFTSEQIKKEEGLKLLMGKLEDGAFSSNAELYIELNKLEGMHNEGSGFIDAVKQKKERVEKKAKGIVTVAAILVALFVLYGIVNSLRDKDKTKYPNVAKIGSVTIINDKSE